MKKLFVLASCLLCLNACTDYVDELNDKYDEYMAQYTITDNKYVDPRDGNVYQVRVFGNYVWFAENLRYVDSSAVPNLKGNVWCLDNKKSNCDKYGPLYSWYAARNFESGTYSDYSQQGICPSSWWVPDDDEWEKLVDYVSQNNGAEGVGASLKSTTDWIHKEGVHDGVNRFGFNALPGGRRNADDDGFLEEGLYAFFWSSSPVSTTLAHGWTLISENDTIDVGEYYRDHGMSVRCMSYVSSFDFDTTENFVPDVEPDLEYAYDSIFFGEKYVKFFNVNGVDWFAENVNLASGNDSLQTDSYCEDEDSCAVYGRLYTFETASQICPEGWSLPAYSDFNDLYFKVQWAKLYNKDKGWESITRDQYGFRALPAGGYDGQHYYDFGRSAYFWTSDGRSAFIDYMGNLLFHEEPAGTAISVRCIRKANNLY